MNTQGPPVWALAFFPVLWLAVGSLLGAISGWYALMARFPDRAEEKALRELSWQSGSMQGIGMNGILTLGACPAGLRVSLFRMFGPFCRPFFVPWRELVVERKKTLWWVRVVLHFGDSGAGLASLTVRERLANQLREAAGERWPEPVAPVEPR